MGVASAISSIIGKLIDKAVPDKSEANRLKSEIDHQILSLRSQELKSATNVIVAEAGGDSWLQRSWRPITMLTFVGLVVAHWLGMTAPGLSEAQVLSLLDIVKIGLGGYVLGRTGEKCVKSWKKEER